MGMTACGHSWPTVRAGFCGVPTFMIWVVPSVLTVLCSTLGMTWNSSLCSPEAGPWDQVPHLPETL